MWLRNKSINMISFTFVELFLSSKILQLTVMFVFLLEGQSCEPQEINPTQKYVRCVLG